MPEWKTYDVTVQVTMQVRGGFGPGEAASRAEKAVSQAVAPHEQVDGVAELKISSVHVDHR